MAFAPHARINGDLPECASPEPSSPTRSFTTLLRAPCTAHVSPGYGDGPRKRPLADTIASAIGPIGRSVRPRVSCAFWASAPYNPSQRLSLEAFFAASRARGAKGRLRVHNPSAACHGESHPHLIVKDHAPLPRPPRRRMRSRHQPTPGNERGSDLPHSTNYSQVSQVSDSMSTTPEPLPGWHALERSEGRGEWGEESALADR